MERPNTFTGPTTLANADLSLPDAAVVFNTATCPWRPHTHAHKSAHRHRVAALCRLKKVLVKPEHREEKQPVCRHTVKIQPTSVWGRTKQTWHCCPNAEPISQCFYLPMSEETQQQKRVPRDINFFFYFKIFSQQDETQRSPEGPKPIEPSRTEAPLIIAMSLCCRTRRSGEREKERKGKGEETKSSTETHKHIHSSIHIQKELCETQWW